MELSEQVLGSFAFEGAVAAAGPLPGGHINPSWRVTTHHATGARRYLVQQINAAVFTHPLAVMHNLQALLAFVARHRAECPESLPAQREVRLVPTHDGSNWFEAHDGAIWRAFPIIPASSHEVVRGASDARAAGNAFGSFLRLLALYDGPPIADTIPHFHDTAWYLDELDRAEAQGSSSRAQVAAAELQLCRRLRTLTAELPTGANRRCLVHNDAKLANLLFDPSGERPIAVVDLDTVMAGSPLHDAGDLIRSMATTAREDEPDLSRVTAEPDLVAAVLEGWFQGAGDTLQQMERDAAVLAGCVVTLEQAIRFLADYLRGDVYYRCSDPDQNLRRARTQLALLTSLLDQRAQLERRLCGRLPARS